MISPHPPHHPILDSFLKIDICLIFYYYYFKRRRRLKKCSANPKKKKSSYVTCHRLSTPSPKKKKNNPFQRNRPEAKLMRKCMLLRNLRSGANRARISHPRVSREAKDQPHTQSISKRRKATQIKIYFKNETVTTRLPKIPHHPLPHPHPLFFFFFYNTN